MIVFKLEISDRLTPERFSEAAKQAFSEAAKLWHQNMLPKHFKAGAAIRYGYKPRTKRYQKRKRYKGSPPALVYSGRSRDALTARFAFQVSYQKSTGRTIGRFIVPNTMRYFFWMTPAGHPDKPDEMKRVTDQERSLLAAFIQQRIINLMENPKSVTTRIVA